MKRRFQGAVLVAVAVAFGLGIAFDAAKEIYARRKARRAASGA